MSVIYPCEEYSRLTSTRFKLVKCPASSPAINSSAVASRSGGSADGVLYCATTCVKGTTATKVLSINQADTMTANVSTPACLIKKLAGC